MAKFFKSRGTKLPQNASKGSRKKEALIQSYTITMKEDIKSMRDNFDEIIRLSLIRENDRMFKIEQENNEVQIRGANILRAAESLMKLVSELKDHMVINDFYTINCQLHRSEKDIKRTVTQIDEKISLVWADMIRDLEDLEEEYYTSPYPDPPARR